MVETSPLRCTLQTWLGLLAKQLPTILSQYCHNTKYEYVLDMVCWKCTQNIWAIWYKVYLLGRFLHPLLMIWVGVVGPPHKPHEIEDQLTLARRASWSRSCALCCSDCPCLIFFSGMNCTIFRYNFLCCVVSNRSTDLYAINSRYSQRRNTITIKDI